LENFILEHEDWSGSSGQIDNFGGKVEKQRFWAEALLKDLKN